MTQTDDSLLAPYRVLDLTDVRGYLCGRVLRDLGADVVKIEPPSGDPGRRTGPFYKDIPHLEKSLFWFAYNLNKRGVTLDLESADGRALFRQLVATADVLVESFDPGYMARLGLGYTDVAKLNPGLVYVSISAFGQTGPHAHYNAPDIVGMAMGGLMALSGDIERPPVRISYPQAWLHAGAEGAAAAAIALYHRDLAGEGQHVDVSMQQCVIWTTTNATPTWDLNHMNIPRSGAIRVRQASGTHFPIHWPCADGYVTFGPQAVRMEAAALRALVEWLDSVGYATEFLKSGKMTVLDFTVATQEELDQVAGAVGRFFLAHTKADLYEGARRRGIILYPVSTVADLFEMPQLEAREYWVQVPHPELGVSLTYPGPFIQVSEAPVRLRRRAPLIGEHNAEVYCGELGVPRERLAWLKQAGAI
ncbi:MAG: CoA transferase [Chloroflexi bacterium]|nr:CoA transferase [Chloroflexota bacterium]